MRKGGREGEVIKEYCYRVFFVFYSEATIIRTMAGWWTPKPGIKGTKTSHRMT